MFQRGPRFLPTKISEVPGPNTYNLNQESQLESYKRDAFLEKADRFSEDNPSDIPGNTDSATMLKATTKPNLNAQTNERYAALQRKLEDLEKVHAEGKKTHAGELERLKFDLTRANKANVENTDRIEKLKKQNEGLEARLQELRKVNLSDQSEIKELRTKLRISEQERGHLASKQGESTEAKKALASLDSKRKEDIRERDRKIADLEKSLAREQKRREGLEARVQDMKGKTDSQVEEVRGTIMSLRNEVEDALADAEEAKSETRAVEQREERLISDLDQARLLVQRVAEEYGRLASSTVPLKSHEKVKHERVFLNLRVLRLERKLANSEAQVVELAHLIRSSNEKNLMLTRMLDEANGDLEDYSRLLHETMGSGATTNNDNSLDVAAAAIGTEILQQKNQLLAVELQSQRLFSEWTTLHNHEVLLCSHALSRGVEFLHEDIKTHETTAANLKSQTEQLKLRMGQAETEREAASRQASELSTQWEESKAREEALRRELEAREKQRRTEQSVAEEKLKKERESVAQLKSTIQQKKISEDALRVEVETLMTEVAQAEGYQEAYMTLVEEVDALVDRNALAEVEAAKLSKFNAEILGHNNPAQRIMYVDRIRNELADAKQTLLVALRDRDTAYTENDDLRHELDLYKSVSVPMQDKPRTTLTRVGRAPFHSQNLNLAPP